MMMDPRRRVLIVDDEEEIRKLIKERLETGNFRVVSCGTLAEATRAVSNQKFDCILLDYCIRDGTTEKLLETIRKSRGGYNRNTPVILISGKLDSDAVKKLAPLVNGALVKPVQVNAILDHINSVL